MAKKLKANIFVYSANDLISGNVVFYSEQKGWVKDFLFAKRIMKEELIRDRFQWTLNKIILLILILLNLMIMEKLVN